MNKKESNKAPGFGVNYTKNVSVRKDRISGHGDMKMSDTKAEFNRACKDTKKA